MPREEVWVRKSWGYMGFLHQAHPHPAEEPSEPRGHIGHHLPEKHCPSPRWSILSTPVQCCESGKCVALGWSIHLSGPQFPHLYNEEVGSINPKVSFSQDSV